MKINKFRLHKALRNVENRTSKEAGRMKIIVLLCKSFIKGEAILASKESIIISHFIYFLDFGNVLNWTRHHRKLHI